MKTSPREGERTREPRAWKSISFSAATALALLLAAQSAPAHADDRPTFTRDVLPILQENCQSCHRPQGANMSGMIAPMSLMTYQEVRPWAKAIAKAVEAGNMPPWHATKEFHGVFKNERSITDEERDTILAWVNSGAQRGNPDDAPPPLEFKDAGWQLSETLGEPDLLLKMEEPFFVADDVQDIQPRIQMKLTKEQLPEMKWVRAIEYRPGSEVVHHIVGGVTRPGENNIDMRTNFGQIASGTNPQNYREGYGLPLYPDSTIHLSMHYHKEVGPGTGKYDQSEIAVWFHDA
ncbi:MAG: c-type cytochrome, partial [Candidatus Hydrogenedentales bacterium]